MLLKLNYEDLRLSAKVWGALAEILVPRYPLPTWATDYNVKLMEIWLERIELEKDAFLLIGGWKKLEKFADTSPEWPLRGAIGLALEEKAEITGVALSSSTRTPAFQPRRAHHVR